MRRPKTTREMRKLLIAEMEQAGSQRKWCAAHGITPSLVTQFLVHTPCPPAIAKALGYERRVTYVEVPHE